VVQPDAVLDYGAVVARDVLGGWERSEGLHVLEGRGGEVRSGGPASGAGRVDADGGVHGGVHERAERLGCMA
jgi:hypothetical protein